jgi:hypothetical protein
MEVLAKEIKQEKEIKVCIKKEEQKLYFQMTGSYVPKILRNAHTYTHTHLLEPINKIIKVSNICISILLEQSENEIKRNSSLIASRIK